MPRSRWGAIAAMAVLLAGCGSDGGDEPRLSEAQALTLLAPLAEARSAARSHQPALTEQAMSRFRSRVARLRREGALTDGTARSLRIGAARILARVRNDNPAPAAQPPATETTPAPEPAEKKGNGGKKGKGKKKGKKK